MKSCSLKLIQETSVTGLVVSLGLVLSLVSMVASPAYGQAPVPGEVPASTQSSPAPNQGVLPIQPIGQRTQAPLPGNAATSTANSQSAYQQLPLNVSDAQTRIEDLKQSVATARPSKELQDSVYQLCEWLTDMANAHYKLATVFSKQDATKPQSEQERKQAQKFSQLKNQAQLLKAELLIRQNRYPEALEPLVEIVSAEPRSATGQQAYKRLQQIGFSEEVQPEYNKVQGDAIAASQNSASDNKSNATISRPSISIEGFVGSPTRNKPAVRQIKKATPNPNSSSGSILAPAPELPTH